MKFQIKMFCLLTLFLFISACGGEIDTSMLKEGDIVFQNKRSKASDFITYISGSKYNNVGILHSRDKKWYVLEAVQPVQLTPIASWIKEGEDKHYVVKRLKDEDTILTSEVNNRMKNLRKEFMGKSFDSQYEWSDDKLYPSELVWKIFNRAAGIELSKLETLDKFILKDDDAVRQRVKDVYGTKVPLYEEVATPDAIYNSSLLIKIMEN